MKIAIVFDTKTGNTERLAKAIAEGVEEAWAEAELRKIGEKFPLSIIGEVDAVMFGTPVIYADVTNEMRDFLQHVNRYIEAGRLDMGDQVAAIFGSYGYDGAWIMEERLILMVQELGYSVYENVHVEVDTEIRHNTEETMENAREFGKKFAESLK
jgi:flavorubredoxin